MPDSATPPLRWIEQRSNHGGVDEIPLPAGLDGRLWLCGKQFVAPDPEAALAYVSGTAVICLNEESDLKRWPEYVEWLNAQPPTRVLWCPIPDLYVPPRDTALDLLDQLRVRLDDGQSVLMHCGAGIGRAGTIAAGLLVTLGAAPQDAVAHVRAHRPMAGPEAGPQTELLYWLAARSASNLGAPTDGKASNRLFD
jgi:protein-tyrosine phosphatase